MENHALLKPWISSYDSFQLTCTKRGMPFRPRMTALLWASLARICRAPTVPSTISSMRTPSTYPDPCPLELIEALWKNMQVLNVCEFSYVECFELLLIFKKFHVHTNPLPSVYLGGLWWGDGQSWAGHHVPSVEHGLQDRGPDFWWDQLQPWWGAICLVGEVTWLEQEGRSVNEQHSGPFQLLGDGWSNVSMHRPENNQIFFYWWLRGWITTVVRKLSEFLWRDKGHILLVRWCPHGLLPVKWFWPKPRCRWPDRQWPCCAGCYRSSWTRFQQHRSPHWDRWRREAEQAFARCLPCCPGEKQNTSK